MALDALLAYLHFTAIFLLFGFLSAQAVMLRNPLDVAGVRMLGRVDILYALSAVLVLATGLARLFLGAKGAQIHLGGWPFHAKVTLFIAVALLSIKPTLVFIRWRKAMLADAAWRVPAGEQAAMRKLVMLEVHLAALIPIFAVMMARGLGYR